MNQAAGTPIPIVAHIFSGAFGLQTADAVEWCVLGIALTLLAGLVVAAHRAGRRAGGAASESDRLAAGCERITGLPAWAGGGILVGLWGLATAFVGFMWDVAWHIDLGRDRELFTVPHTLIILGLAGIGAAAVVSIRWATRARVDAGWRTHRFVVPAGAGLLLALSAAGVIAFPLDDLWHATYGIDVTMWSPTHLVMIGAGSLTPLGLTLLLWEARPRPSRKRTVLQTVLLGTVLVGLSTFQLEFDMGVPQWQALYHPLLIALAAGFGLTAARALLGPWGAVRTALVFLVLRGVLSLLVGPILGHTVPHFPLYLVEALGVEVAFALARRALPRALAAGALIGTAGMAAEWLWMEVWGLQPWQPEMLPMMWVPLLGALAASVAGVAFAAALRADVPALHLPRRLLAPAATVLVLALLAVPFPRQGAAATVHVTEWRVSRVVDSVDRNGQRVRTFDVAVTAQLDPAGTATGADWFRVVAWQGGGVVAADLMPTGHGTYVADRSVPVGGNWKAIVFLAKGSTLAAAPVVMPAEPDQGLAAVPLLPSRTASLANAQVLLLRESHGGAVWVADLAYAIFALTVAVWLAVLGAAAVRVRRGGPRGQRRPSAPSYTPRSASLKSAKVTSRSGVASPSSAARASPSAIGAARSTGKP